MKLSEMTTEQLADALVALAGPMGRIARDEALNKALARLDKRRSGTALEQLAAVIEPLIPALLTRHREDTYRVLAALLGKSPEAIAAQSAALTIREARACFDGELRDFFS